MRTGGFGKKIRIGKKQAEGREGVERMRWISEATESEKKAMR